MLPPMITNLRLVGLTNAAYRLEPFPKGQVAGKVQASAVGRR